MLALALVACKGKRDDGGHGSAKGSDGSAAAIVVDWAACESALEDATVVPFADVATKLITGCKVCGEWAPILDWNRRQEDGGPRRQAIIDAMSRCGAFCDSTAKTYFMGTLDAARGTPSQKPWVELGKECKQGVSALPDPRFVSGPYFALDRIARAAVAHGGKAARLAAQVEVPLPALTLSGVGVELPKVDALARAMRYHVSVLGDQLFYGGLPRAKLGADGLTVSSGAKPYPGDQLTESTAVASADIAIVAPKAMRATRVIDAIELVERRNRDAKAFLAIAGAGTLPAPHGLAIQLVSSLVATPRRLVINDAMTVEELAAAIVQLADAKPGPGAIALVRAKGGT